MNPPPNRQGKAPLLTEVAHQWLRQCIAAHRSTAAQLPQPPQRKMLAIDATAGNGHDTLFLAKELGAGGQLAAFDIQLAALEQTAQRLRSAGISNVQLAGTALPTVKQESPLPSALQEPAMPATRQQSALLAAARQESARPTTQQDAQHQADEAASVALLHTSHANIAQAVPQSWRGGVCAITFNLGYLPGGDKEIVTHTASTLQALENALLLLSPEGLLSVLCYPGHGEGAREAAAIADWCKSTLPARGFSSRWINAGSNAPASAPLLLHVFRAA